MKEPKPPKEEGDEDAEDKHFKETIQDWYNKCGPLPVHQEVTPSLGDQELCSWLFTCPTPILHNCVDEP